MRVVDIENTELRRRGLLKAGLVTFGAGIAALSPRGAAEAAPAPASSNLSADAAKNWPPSPSDAVDPIDRMDPPKPLGMKPHGVIDPRYPVAYRRSVPAACRVMTAHFDAIAMRNSAALARTMHFPFGIVERLDTMIVETPEQLATRAPASLNFSPHGQLGTDHESHLDGQMYDMLISLEVISFDPVHVSMAMTYDRFNRHGIRTARCEGVYCVTNNDGRWAIQYMSTIWKPDDLVGQVYLDAEQAAMRLRANHTDSYINDEDVIDHPRPHRGIRAGITGGGIGNLIDLGEGDAMSAYKIAGVTTRLSRSDRARPGAFGPDGPGGTGQPRLSLNGKPIDRNSPDPRDRTAQPREPKWASQPRSWANLGIDNWWESHNAPAARIIHSSSSKVHRYAGAARYNMAGEQLNISMEVGIIVMGSGDDWVDVGSLRYTTVHDRLNDDI